MIDAQAVLALAAKLRIAHHITGRIRLKLSTDLAAEALAAAEGLNAALSKANGIRSVTVNPLARSCTVEYDPRIIPPPAWEDLLAGSRSAAAAALMEAVLAAGQSIAQR